LLSAAVQVEVATAVPQGTIPSDESTLHFGVIGLTSSLSNAEQWTTLLDTFSATDPDIAQADFEVSTIEDLTEVAQRYDCFYLANNPLATFDTDVLLPLDPLMDADPGFNPDDFVAQVLPQFQQDGRTYGLPLVISPLLLSIDTEQFNKAGVPIPEQGWRVAEFADALDRLHAANPSMPALSVLSPDPVNTHLLILIAAHGGLPIDYRTQPVSVNFTEAMDVAAIRQVLDLVKAGYISYEGASSVLAADAASPIRLQWVDPLGQLLFARGGNNAHYRVVGFPSGSYTAATFGVNAG
jgi:ABC-type glycerol-3-phosphate transport system substrate-binding protein